MQPDPFKPQTVTRTSTYDVGLRSHFQRVYNTMSIGLVITGVVAFLVANTEALRQLIFGTPLYIVFALAPLAFTFFGFSPRAVMTKSAAQLATMFYLFSGVFGVSMATIFMVYGHASIARAFFIAAGMFAGTSIIGYTTKKDLTGFGGLMLTGAMGLLIAMLVGMVWHSSGLQFVISILGIVIYTGLIAWNTQTIKETYSMAYSSEDNNKMAVMSALNLYISFLMIFQMLLRLMGNSRN